MNVFLKGLPTVLIVAALVAVFVALYRHERTARMRFWISGWGIIFLHFLVGIVPAQAPWAVWLVSCIELATLPIAGSAFLISVTDIIQVPSLRRSMLLVMSVPMVVYSALLVSDSHLTGLYLLLAGWIFFGGIACFLAWWRKLTLYVGTTAVLVCAVGVIACAQVLRGNVQGAFYSGLLLIYGWSAVLFVRAYWRRTPGVLLTCGGFLSWAAIWALGAFVPQVIAYIGIENGLWDVPKLFVAFGMILTILEEESLAAQASGERERLLNVQMVRFADITSRLLSGVEVRSLCTEIAQVITEVANFRRVVIILADETNHLYVAGDSGVTDEVREEIREKVKGRTPDVIADTCSKGRKIGNQCYLCPSEVMDESHRSRSMVDFEPNPHWHNGDELYVALRSAQGNIVGCISLDDPKDVNRITPEEMSKIEMLAGDLAVAIESVNLQRRMVLQEKMASVGQLVAGVAHELNNPLTAVIGYAELMGDSDTDGRFERELGTIRREAQRMKIIIDNLLRFARQAKTQTRFALLQQVLTEAITLRQYDMTRLAIEIERDIPSDLPPVLVDEAQLKTVLVNLLSNASEALQDCKQRRITLHAHRIGARVLFSVLDSGNGFIDVHRAFDPFFTTKPPGRGPGLGLSICYGIIKQHGGDIYARNTNPNGACITIELPIATTAEAAAEN